MAGLFLLYSLGRFFYGLKNSSFEGIKKYLGALDNFSNFKYRFIALGIYLSLIICLFLPTYIIRGLSITMISVLVDYLVITAILYLLLLINGVQLALRNRNAWLILNSLAPIVCFFLIQFELASKLNLTAAEYAAADYLVGSIFDVVGGLILLAFSIYMFFVAAELDQIKKPNNMNEEELKSFIKNTTRPAKISIKRMIILLAVCLGILILLFLYGYFITGKR